MNKKKLYITKEELANGVSDEQGVVYSRDGKRVIRCENNELTHYAIKEGTEEIGLRSFEIIKSLTEIVIPKSVTTIEERAFHWCENLSRIVVAEDNPAFCVVDGILFSKDMTTLVYFPARAPFTSYEVPESVRTIEPHAFENCSTLTQLTISRNVIYIGDDAFGACSSLAAVNYYATACEKAGEDFLPTIFPCRIPNITIGDNVTRIPANLFRSCVALKEITIPFSVTEIGKYAFNCCYSLEHITIPEGVTKIGGSTFSDCTNLKEIVLSSSITKIDYFAFSRCTSLKTIVLPDSITDIGEGAFYGCTNLTECFVSKNVTHIDDFAFFGCECLKEISLPDGLTHIGSFAFERCNSLNAIRIPRSVTEIGHNVFHRSSTFHIEIEEGNNAYCVQDEVLYSKDMTTLVEHLNLTRKGAFVVPETVKTIIADAFEESSLSSITLPDGLVHIGRFAFRDCKELTSVTLPQTMISMGESIFANCWGLKAITSLNPIPPHIDFCLFDWDGEFEYEEDSTYLFGTLRVPKGAKSAYATAYKWKEFKNIEEIE